MCEYFKEKYGEFPGSLGGEISPRQGNVELSEARSHSSNPANVPALGKGMQKFVDQPHAQSHVVCLGSAFFVERPVCGMVGDDGDWSPASTFPDPQFLGTHMASTRWPTPHSVC